MRPSQVTCVTLASGTFNRTLSPHRTCVALILSLTYNGLVQHMLQKFGKGCEFVVACDRRVVMVRVPCTTESMPLNRRIFASVQLVSREALMLCSLPKQRHLLCCCSLQQSRSFFPLLSGIVLDFLGPMDANLCLRLVMVMSVRTVLQIGPATVLSSFWGL